MPADTQSIALVIDDDLADLDLLAIGWANAGHDASIAIHTCTSSKEAIFLLHVWKTPGIVVSGVLVDLMLVDADGCAAVDVMSALPILNDVPIIAWSDGEDEEKASVRLARPSTRVWKKPGNWSEYADFIRRFRTLLDGRSTACSTELAIDAASF
jgi:CheY-like chemotaxis protein